MEQLSPEQIKQYKRVRAIYLERVKSCENMLKSAGVPEEEWSNHNGL